jgi:biotin carboxylase
MTTILILGAGVMQEPGIRIAKRRGWRVVLADGNPRAQARGLADRFEAVDLKDKEGLLALARNCAESTGLDGVFTAGTDFSASVAWVAEKMGLPGIPYEAAMRATDKCLMREAFARAGVPSPRFLCWTGEGDPRVPSAEGLGFPLVVKPVDNMGARGVRRVDSPEGLSEACSAALPLSRSHRVIIERFMEGPELSLDAIVYEGRVTVCGVADRHICFPPSFVEMGHTMPTALDAGTVRRIERVFADGIRALGIDRGAAKGDIKLTPEGPMIGEIAARLSGGYMSGWTFPLASGVEVTEAAMNVAVGLPPGDLTPQRHRTCAERALISVPGIVDAVAGVEDARRLPGVTDVFLRAAAGDEVVFPANNVQKCGNVLAVAEAREAAIATAQRALGSILLRLRPLTIRTTHYLFHESGNDAVTGLSSPFLESLRAMPGWVGELAQVRSDGPVAVLPLRGAEDPAFVDWYGGSLSLAVQRALQLGNGSLEDAPHSGVPAVGSIFWRAVLRGGTQGGVYLLDSVRIAARQGTVKELLASL